MHTCYLLAHSPKMQQLLTPFRIFTVVFSGLCHDVGHTGFTNLFEIASHSRKAITYNDNSVLISPCSPLKTTTQRPPSSFCASQRTTS
jgi:cAMP-specific phosphodiesterase 4